jgi:N-acetylglucosamine-6-phosphate deacetylase
MQPRMEEFVLAHPEMSTEVIADGQHLAKELLEFAWRMKGPERLCLVTDANRAFGMPPGRYRFGPIEDGAWFESNGKVGFVPGSGLASSVVALDTMVRNMKAMTSAPLHDVIRMATLTPAERTGIDADTGSLEPGKRADILILDRRLAVHQVFCGAGTPACRVDTLVDARPRAAARPADVDQPRAGVQPADAQPRTAVRSRADARPRAAPS